MLLRVSERQERLIDSPLEDEETIFSVEETEKVRREGGEKAVESIAIAAVDLVRRQVELHGWFNPVCNKTVAESLREIRRFVKDEKSDSTNYSSSSRAGSDYLKAHFKSYWIADKGPAVRVFDKRVLLKIIAYRLGLNSSQTVYPLSLKQIRRGFISGRYTVSFFKPTTAALIAKKWLSSCSEPKMWDPSAGFGARMLGFASVFPTGTYIANEPAKQTFSDLTCLAQKLREAEPGLTIVLVNEGSEKERELPIVDLVFTSPPYFDQEKYFEEEGQCWRDYPIESDWVEKYLKPTLIRAKTYLSPEGKLVLNIKESLKMTTVKAAEESGFNLVAEEKLLIPADHFSRNRGKTETRTEPVLIFTPSEGDEIWREIEGSNRRYFVSNKGNVKSYTRQGHGSLMTKTVMASGYLSVGLTLSESSRAQTFLIHRLVASAFFGPPPTAQHTDVRHLDGNKKNNQVSNLAWGTRSENMLDVIEHKKIVAEPIPVDSERSRQWYSGRTNDVDLVKVCIELHTEKKLNIPDIARILSCTYDTASNILTGKTHKHIEVQRKETKIKRSEQTKEKIKALIRNGKDRAQVMAELNEDLTAQEFYYYKQTARKK